MGLFDKKEFKVGDAVAVCRSGFGRRRIEPGRTVKRVLKRFLELDDGTKWELNGRPYPRPMSRYSAGPYLEPWTKEIQDEYALDQLESKE